jgi:uncharacterized protein (DUF362 family)
MNRSDNHDGGNHTPDHDPAEELVCEVCEGDDPDSCNDAGSERRGFLRAGLAVGVAAGLAACQGGGRGKDKGAAQSTGDMTTAPPKAGGPARKAPLAREAPRPAAPKPQTPRPAGTKKSRVVQVVNSKAYDAKGQPDPKPVKVMVDRAVMELTGTKTPKAAWSSLFKPGEKVGLKPNCLGRHLCWPHPATVDAIIEGLVLAGVDHANMYMWDMWGFNASPLARRYSNSKMKVNNIKSWGYSRKKFKIASGPAVQFTKALLAVDAVVNIPVLKDHDLTGVTCSIKNMALGSVPKPAIYHTSRQGKRMCDPMVPEIYALPPIKDKVRLILADAFNIIVDGGPKGNARGLRKLHSVFAAQDPVAMDKIAWEIIDALRVKATLPKLMDKPLTKTRPKGRPHYIATAEKLGLGTADLKKIQHVTKVLG